MFGFVKKFVNYISDKLFGKVNQSKQLNRLDDFGYHAVHDAIARNDVAGVQVMMNNPAFDMQKVNSENNMLFECALHGRSDMAKLLMQKGMSLDEVIDEKGTTVKNVFALNSDARAFFKDVGAFQTDQEIDDFITLSKSKAILNLSYSNEGFGARPAYYRKILYHGINDSNFAYKDDALNVLEMVQSDGRKSVQTKEGNHLKVEKVCYQGHAAYFIIESDSQHNPLKITYCDGNDVFESNDKMSPKAITFALDPDKIKKLSKKNGGWLDAIQEDFRSCKMSNDMYDNNGEKFRNTMAKVAICDKKGQPIICDQSVEAKKQKRGNCALKSFNIIFRKLIDLLNPGINFGGTSPDGHNLYKDYKESITKKPINNLLLLADDSNKGKASHQEALEYLQESVFLKMVAKNDVASLKVMKALFDSNGIDMFSIQSHKGKNAFDIAHNQGCQEALNWLHDSKNAPKVASPNSKLNSPNPIVMDHQAQPLTSSSKVVGASVA